MARTPAAVNVVGCGVPRLVLGLCKPHGDAASTIPGLLLSLALNARVRPVAAECNVLMDRW